MSIVMDEKIELTERLREIKQDLAKETEELNNLR